MTDHTREDTLYERIGGEAGIDAMVVAFYNRVLSDGDLAPFFEHVEMDKLRDMQREFFSAALGGDIDYSGPPLRHTHHAYKIERRHFARFVDYLLETLRDRGMAEGDVSAIIARVNTYSDDIIGGHGVDG